VDNLLSRVLFLFGVGFLIANLRLVRDLVRYRRRRPTALLIWPSPRPGLLGFSLTLGVVLALLLAFKALVQRRPPQQLFGEAMMFVYYAVVFPLSLRIARGLYRDGVWSDSGFMRWAQISAISWKEEGPVTLVLVSRARHLARRLVVPGHLYGQVRRLLRDRVKAHDIDVGGGALGLGTRDEADAV
jgi:hypothetical protein